MGKARWLALVVLFATMGLVAGQSTTKTAKPKENRDETIAQRIARDTKLSEKDADKFYNAVGAAIRDQLKRGKTVSVPGLGTFRVVRVAEHKDLSGGGRPVVVPAFNTVEFVGSNEVADAANAEGVAPSVEVPAFQYIVNPYQTPGQKMGRTHTQSQRVR
jgi:nucleoid DNA-binding protein